MDIARKLTVAIWICQLVLTNSSASVKDRVQNTAPDPHTSILNLGQEHTLLDKTIECCPQQFHGIRMDFGASENLDAFLIMVNSTNENGSRSLEGFQFYASVDIFFGGRGDRVHTAVEQLINEEKFHLLNHLIVKVPFIVCSPSTDRYRTAELYSINGHMESLQTLLRKHTNISLGIEPLGYKENYGCYLANYDYGPGLLQNFDFAIITVEIDSLIYTFDQFRTFVLEKSSSVIRGIGLMRKKIEVVLDVKLNLNKDINNLNSRDHQVYNSLVANFVYRYGAENKMRVQYALFKKDALLKGEIEVGRDFEKIIILNRNLVQDDFSYERLETYLSVISRDFSTILIDLPENFNSAGLSNWLKKLDKFNKHFMEKRMSVIIRMQHEPGYHSEVTSPLTLFSSFNKKYPGILLGVILKFSTDICSTRLSQFQRGKLGIALNDAEKIKNAALEGNIRLLALGCDSDVQLNTGVIQLMEALRMKNTSLMSYYQPSSPLSTVEELLEHFRRLEKMQESRGFDEIWVEFGWGTSYIGRGNDCRHFKLFYEMAMNWAAIHRVNIITGNAFDSELNYQGWFKTIAASRSGMFEEKEDFVAKVEDPCILPSTAEIEERIPFNTRLSSVSVNANLPNITSAEFSVVIQMVTMRFNTLELTAAGSLEANEIMESIAYIQRERGTFNILNLYISLSNSNMNLGNINKHLDHMRNTILQIGNISKVTGIHFDNGDNCSQLADPKLKLPSRNSREIKLGFVMRLIQSTIQEECPPQLYTIFDYVLLDVDLQSLITPLVAISITFTERLKSNSLVMFQDVFDHIREFDLNTKRVKPDFQVKLRFRWPKPKINFSQDTQLRKVALENMLRFWKFVDEFCSTFNFSYIIFPALDDEHSEREEDVNDYLRRTTRLPRDQVKTWAGWWRITNYTNLSDLSVYVEKESEFLEMETPKPLRVFFLPERSTTNFGPKSKDDDSLLNIVGASLVLLFLATIIIVLAVHLQRRNAILSKDEVRKFVEGLKDCEDSELDGESKVLGLAYDTSLEINKEEFRVEKSRIIGMGNFGIVYQAEIPRFNEAVAVKVPLKGNTPERGMAFRNFLSEIKIMSCLREHGNVVKILGAYTKEIRKGMAFLVTEYCEKGPLLGYLRNLATGLDPNCEWQQQADIYELQRFAQEIASGMDYITSKNIIHGDLSARNILLDGSTICKICDFGLARKLDNYGKCLKGKEELLPWRWMAVESLKRVEFTMKSDVWSFGVLLWEVFTLGEVPFPGMEWDLTFVDKLEDGLRLQSPRYGYAGTYEILCQCWKLEPSERPDFGDLVETFKNLRKNEYVQVVV